MYFNNLPQGFGQAQTQQPDLMNKPILGYNQNNGIAGLQGNNQWNQQMANPAQPAPQLQNAQAFPFGTPTNSQPQMPNSQAQSGVTNTTSGLGGKSITPLMPYQRGQGLKAGQQMAGGGVVGQNLDKARVVSEGIAALRGGHPDPRAALAAYDAQFGPEATAELMKGYADGGIVSGPGSGVADLVPGSIDGREDVRIASGEYVIPAWAVSALGDGSSEAGARILDAMVARLREEGSEKIMGTEPINPSEFLPA